MSLLVILGMHRSGTSSLTGVLSLLGFSAGNQLMPPNEFNERGYFEDINLNKELDSFLSALDRSWRDERAHPNDWLLGQAAAAASQKLEDLFRSDFDFSKPTVIKNPRICRLLPLIRPIWSNVNLTPKYVLSLRSPLAVIHSLGRRDSISPQRAALLYVAYMLEAELNTRNQPRTFVQYEDLLQDWRKVVSHIESELKLDNLSTRLSDSTCSAEIDNFLTQELNHYDNEEPKPSGVAIDLANDIYELLRSPLNDSQLSDLNAVRHRWCHYLSSLEPWLSETAAVDRINNNLSSALFNPSNELILRSTANAKSSLYWACIGEGFAEARKVSASWVYDKQISHRFVIPALTKPLKALRWDITDRPAFCLIEKVWIEDSIGQVQWTSTQDGDLFTSISGEMHIIGPTKSGYLQVMASGFDPHGTVIIPDSLLNLIEPGWVICTLWQAKLPFKHLPQLMQQYSATFKKLTEIEHTLHGIKNERDSLVSTTVHLTDELRSLKSSYHLIQEHVLRAEGQIEILKQLMLSGEPSSL